MPPCCIIGISTPMVLNPLAAPMLHSLARPPFPAARSSDGTDSISGSNVTLVGTATISGGSLNLPGGGVFANYGYVNLANTLLGNPTLSVECWYTQNALTTWSKVWMFGFD